VVDYILLILNGVVTAEIIDQKGGFEMSVFNFPTLSILSLFPALVNTVAADEKVSAMVTERWGVEGRIQHPNTLHYEDQPHGNIAIHFELSALTVGIEVYRARLFVHPTERRRLDRADLYAYIHGWGMPEVTKGFQCWDWARGAWGPPEAYQDKPEDENPFYLQDYTRWILENPPKTLPYFYIHMGWGAHFTEIGWPPFPRFARAMIDTKRAFCMNSPVIESAIEQGVIEFRRNLSVPAFGNCSLDDNIGDGNLRCGKPFGQINGYLVWESSTIADEPELYEIAVYLWSGDNNEAPLDSCTVDFTPRNCQKFNSEAGQRISWSNVKLTDGKQIQDGRVTADQYGLATIKDLVITKNKHRIALRSE